MKTGIAELEEKIRDVRNRMPAHSIKPEMVQQLEELEEELEILKARDIEERIKYNQRGKE